MAKKAHIKEQIFRCIDCAHAEPVWEHWNLDYTHHAPICYRCPFVTNRLMIRSEKACEHFKEKEK